MKIFFSQKFFLAICLAVWGFAPIAAYSAADLSDVWQVNLSESFGYDDNLFRLSKLVNASSVLKSRGSKSDFINKASLGGTVNYWLGRQNFLINLNIDDNRFVNNRFLDNQSTDDKAIWKWAFGKYLSGDVGYGFRRYLGGFTNTTFFGADLISENSSYFNGNVALDPNWRIRGGVRWFDASHSASQRNFLDMQTVGATLGGDFINATNNTTGLEYRFTEADLPNRQRVQDVQDGIDNHYQEQSINALMKWRICDKTFFDGRIGYTNREHRTFHTRDFSGETWRMSIAWDPTAKIAVNLAAWHELQSWSDITASYLVSEGVSLSPSWSITQKVTLMGKVSKETRNYAGDPGIIKGAEARVTPRSDDIFGGQFGLRYFPFQNAEMNLMYQAEHRSSTHPGSDYAYSSIFGSLAFKF